MFLINENVLVNENMCHAFLQRILCFIYKTCKVICMLTILLERGCYGFLLKMIF
jgi:hypothetical protein